MSQSNRGPFQVGITLEEARAEHYAALAAAVQAHMGAANTEEERSAQDAQNVAEASATLQQGSSATHIAALCNATVADEGFPNPNFPFLNLSEMPPAMQEYAANRIPSLVQAAAAHQSSNPGQDGIGTYGTQQMPVASQVRAFQPSSNDQSPSLIDESVGLYTGEPSATPSRDKEVARRKGRNNPPGLAGTHPSMYAGERRTIDQGTNIDPLLQISPSPVPHLLQSRSVTDPGSNVDPRVGGHSPVPHQNPNVAPLQPASIRNVAGYYDSNGFFVASSLPRRFLTDYVSPYTKGSVRYVGATGYAHAPEHRKTGELIPGLAVSIVGPPFNAEPAQQQPATPRREQSSGGQEINTERSFTPRSHMVGSNIYRDPDTAGQENESSLTDAYLDPNQYLAYLERRSPYAYDSNPPNTDRGGAFPDTYGPKGRSMDRDSALPGTYGSAIPSMDRGSVFPDQSVASDHYVSQNTNVTNNGMYHNQRGASHENLMPSPSINQDRMFRNQGDDSYETASPDTEATAKPRKRKNGTLYDENGRLPYPKRHYTEYMNGIQEMNGRLATPDLAPIPCRACTRKGLACRRLKRAGDRGKVFVKMRIPWVGQEVSSYVVCANCWVSGQPQTCSFWTPKPVKPALPRRKTNDE